MKTGVVLPDTFLRCVSPEDREKLKLGLTASEFMAKGAAANEKALQRQIVSLLRLKGIEPLVPAFGKKTRITIGWPDITFAVNGRAVCWEIKHGEAMPSDEQRAMAIRLMSPPNNWDWYCVRSLDSAIKLLQGMGIE